MTEGAEKTSADFLNAEGLLKNRGIRHEAWGEWEKSSRVLPKTGEKQFEPNNSWLQNKQIEKGLTNRKNLLNIQRVERNSQLATAIWLEHEKKAQVIKKSRQDWSCFGTETKKGLLLTPEETLILIELNCLELTWDNVVLSVQQAYEILIEEDESQCTIDEYRAYSHLVKQGYRVQRYCRDLCTSSVSGYVKWVRMTRNVYERKKFIVNPINGLRMNDGNSEKDIKEKEQKDLSIANLVSDVKGLIDDMINEIEQEKTESPKVEETLQTNDSLTLKLTEANAVLDTQQKDCCVQELPGPSNVHQANSLNNNGRRIKPKIGIISEETVLEPVRLIKCSPGDKAVLGNSAQKWPGSRIQRNVKLLPKRNDKVNVTAPDELPDITMVHDLESLNSSPCSPEKRKECPVSSVLSQNKRSKHEVIELSDDEVEEIPHSMSRMEMLNFLPNIASESIITEKISRRYLPQNVRPQNNTYQYVRWKMYNIQEADKRIRMGFKTGRTEIEATNSVENQNNNITLETSVPGIEMVTCNNQNQNEEQGFTCLLSAVMNVARSILPAYMQQTNTHLQRHRMLRYMNRMPSYQTQRYSIPTRYFQGNISNNPVHMRHFRSHHKGFPNNPSSLEHHRPSFPMVHRNYNLGIPTAQSSYFYPTVWHNNFQQYHPSPTAPLLYQNGMFLSQQSSQHQGTFSLRTPRNPQNNHGPQATTSETSLKNNQNGHHHFGDDKDNNNQPSFIKLPGASSWTELKKKWIDEKTIIIDDEEHSETQDDMDCSEVQVINETTKPLVTPKNVNSIPEVYEKLQIIKSASEKSIRRRRCDYKISYNVYSSTQPFKKSCPGVPIFRVVVTSKRDDAIIQPADLIQLQLDGEDVPIIVAYVSGSSISFTQCGVVSIPNLISD
ncbi:uncharacterized protein LOC107264853 [Cephus cinctus]|uniref:Uncharacterized protein LOC107264853 n=1 Tax=Cephus cinctus TaxID=211228 RepID=A0AAJ7FFD4_CEPCN|nr:uncharacterized protein LOC107264853 [Cephus cinctus]